jgi:hypothetical protein
MTTDHETDAAYYRGYGHDLDTMIAAAVKWYAEHCGHAAPGPGPHQVPKLHWHTDDGTMIIGALAQWLETIAGNAAGSAFLKALDAAVSGRATVIMAQTAHYEATRAGGA